MEYTREVKVIIEIDTNKETYFREHDNLYEGSLNILELLSNEVRLKIFSNYCTHCGSNDKTCQCWNDE